jgi:SulP family sulfate permease
MKPKLLTTLQGYTRAAFKQDVSAGITVALVAVPLSIAIAIASGAGPQVGLVTAIVGGFLISLLGGSRVQIGGPTGAFIVVVYDVIARHGYQGLVTATLMAGVILLFAGAMRAGRLVALVPEPVINGFTIGIGIIIGTSQLKDVFGLKTGAVPADFLPKLETLWAARATVNPSAVLVGLLCIILITVFRQRAPKLPGLIVAVAIGSALVAMAGLPVETIHARFGALPTSLPMPHFPPLSGPILIDLLPSVLIIAFLAGIESLLSAMVADRMIGSQHRSNAELLAQGAANIGSALFGGLPATGAIARTATNVRAGGRTPVSGIVHALTILVLMMVAGQLVGMLAMPALGAVLLLTAWNMTEPHQWRHHAAMPWPDLLLLLLTMFLTVFADLTVAIGTGVILGLIFRKMGLSSAAQGMTTPDR